MKKPLDTALLFAEIDKSVRTEVDTAVAAVMQEQATVDTLAEKRMALEMRNVELRLDIHDARLEKSEHIVDNAMTRVKACEAMCAEAVPVKTAETVRTVADDIKACGVMCDGIQTRCAQMETKVAELANVRTEPTLTKPLEARLAALVDAKLKALPSPSIQPTPRMMPSEYVIDVARGADNRVRSLKVSAEDTQLDIDVVRGGDDRVQSLRVRTHPRHP